MGSTRWAVWHILILFSIKLSNDKVKAVESCSFCPNGDEVTEPDKILSLPEFSFSGTCQTIASLTATMLTADDKECRQIQELSAYCGCPSQIPNPCSLCHDGSQVPFPDLEIPILAAAFRGISPTCGLVDAYLASQPADGGACSSLQLFVASYCGCPARPDHCVICHGEALQEQYRDKVLPFLTSDEINIQGTCETLWLAQYQHPADEQCSGANNVAFHCGCNNGILGYYGTSTKQQQAAVVWVARTVGIASLVASLLVMRHIAAREETRASPYHQLMFLVAIFDSATSIVWIVGPAAIPKINESTGLTWGIYGTGGTKHSCTIAGFFYQLGITSVFLNVSLTVYFFLVVVYGYREAKLRKLRICLVAPPLMIGFALAFASIPYIQETWSGCHVDTYPLPKELWSLLLFLALPTLMSTGIILILLVAIYLKVRRQLRPSRSRLCCRSKQGPSRNSGANKEEQTNRTILERKVFWQCVSYAVAFSVTWPIIVFGEFKGGYIDALPFWFWVLVITVAPIQGLNNALCYFRHYFTRKRNTPNVAHNCAHEEETPTSTMERLSFLCRMRLNGGEAPVEEVSDLSMVWNEVGDPIVELAKLNPDDTSCDDTSSVVRTRNGRNGSSLALNQSQEWGRKVLSEEVCTSKAPLESLAEGDENVEN